MTDKKKQEYERGILLALLAFAAFSGSDGTRKILAHGHYPVMDILFWQGIIGLFALFLFAPFMGGWRGLLALPRLKWHLARSVLIALNTTFSLQAISQVPMMDAYTIFFLTPFVSSILGVILFKEKIGKYRLGAIMLGFVGGFIAFRPGFAELNPAYLYACACVFTFSFSSMIARHIGSGHGNLAFGFWPLVCLLGCILAVNGGAVPQAHNASFLIHAGISGLCYAAALIMISCSFTLAPVAVVSQYQYVQLVFALGFGYYVFGDVPDVYKILGAGVIVGSGIFLFARERRAKRLSALKEGD